MAACCLRSKPLIAGCRNWKNPKGYEQLQWNKYWIPEDCIGVKEKEQSRTELPATGAVLRRRNRKRGYYSSYGSSYGSYGSYGHGRNKEKKVAIGVAAAVVVAILIIVVLGLVLGGKKPDENEMAEAVSEDLVSVDLIFPTVSVDEAVSEDIAEPVTHPDDDFRCKPLTPFYEGYKVYSDDTTATITSDKVISEYAVLIDLSDGHVVARKNADTVIYPASMTKVMTVLVAAENITDLDAEYAVSQETMNYVFTNDCSAVNYEVGEVATARELFYGTILPSGADAALTLADAACGSKDAFVDAMNDKAKELGIANTAHFENPVGIFSEDNKCTVIDMAMIMKAALENEMCFKALSAHKYKTAETEEHPDGINISNRFLRRIEDLETPGEVVAAKTGFVNQSRNCAVSYFEAYDGKEYICVTGKSTSAWQAIYDHVEIYNRYCACEKTEETVSEDTAASENKAVSDDQAVSENRITDKPALQ